MGKYKYELFLITGEKKEWNTEISPEELKIVPSNGMYTLYKGDEVIIHGCFHFEIIEIIKDEEYVVHWWDLYKLALFYFIICCVSFLFPAALDNCDYKYDHEVVIVLTCAMLAWPFLFGFILRQISDIECNKCTNLYIPFILLSYTISFLMIFIVCSNFLELYFYICGHTLLAATIIAMYCIKKRIN